MPDYANPQSLNRYAYGLNNSLRYTDPTGHWVVESNKPEHEQRRNAYVHAAERIQKKDPFSAHAKEYYSAAAAYYEAVATEDSAESIQTQLLHLEDKRNNVVTNGWNGVDAAQSVAVDGMGVDALGIGAFGVNLAGIIFPNRPSINFSLDDGGSGVGWPAGGSGRQVINGITYTEHALEQMEPTGFGGRGVPPSVVENAIQHGTTSPGRTPGTVKIGYENVTVITNDARNVVITVYKTGH